MGVSYSKTANISAHVGTEPVKINLVYISVKCMRSLDPLGFFGVLLTEVTTVYL